MYRLQIESRLLLGAALLTGCSDRSTTTAPSARPLAATTADHSSYTWSVTCNGVVIYVHWDWKDTQLDGTSTVLANFDGSCGDWVGGTSFSGTLPRPANANTFTATVGDNSNSWTFDPAGPFKASLSGSSGSNPNGGHCFICYKTRTTGKVTVDS